MFIVVHLKINNAIIASQSCDAADVQFTILYIGVVESSRGAARIFLRGGLKLWKQKPCKGKIACD